MYCDSDQASLCWNCDARVHAANFLVSKHSRTLLCHSCQSPTPWTASGSILVPTLSVYHTCSAIKHSASPNSCRHQEYDDDDDDDDEEEEEEEEEDEEGDDEGENQVVPSSSSSSVNNLVISDSSTCSEESSSRVFNGFNKSAIGCSWKSVG